eukprot:5371296-Prymnesium_polylepis.1
MSRTYVIRAVHPDDVPPLLPALARRQAAACSKGCHSRSRVWEAIFRRSADLRCAPVPILQRAVRPHIASFLDRVPTWQRALHTHSF